MMFKKLMMAGLVVAFIPAVSFACPNSKKMKAEKKEVDANKFAELMEKEKSQSAKVSSKVAETTKK